MVTLEALSANFLDPLQSVWNCEVILHEMKLFYICSIVHELLAAGICGGQQNGANVVLTHFSTSKIEDVEIKRRSAVGEFKPENFTVCKLMKTSYLM